MASTAESSTMPIGESFEATPGAASAPVTAVQLASHSPAESFGAAASSECHAPFAQEIERSPASPDAASRTKSSTKGVTAAQHGGNGAADGAGHMGEGKDDNPWPALSRRNKCSSGSSSSCSPSAGHLRPDGMKPDEADGPRDVHARLLQQLRAAEQRESQRLAAVASMHNDIHRLRCEAATALERAARLQAEAVGVRATAGTAHVDVSRHGGQVELAQRAEEFARKAALHESREKEWREELDAVARGSAAVEAEIAELRRTAGLWHRAATEQSQLVAKAEARLKNLERQREQLRAQRDRLEPLVAELRGTEDGSAAELQALHAKLLNADAGQRQRLCWQATVALLLPLVFWLLLAW